jgi:hypothetical protein
VHLLVFLGEVYLLVSDQFLINKCLFKCTENWTNGTVAAVLCVLQVTRCNFGSG